jgi:hypothetical protein
LSFGLIIDHRTIGQQGPTQGIELDGQVKDSERDI